MAHDVVDGVTTLWEIEHIPDEDLLYMRAHKMYLTDGRLSHGVFRLSPDGSGMSTNWSKYSTPDKTRQEGNKPPEVYAVISMNVGDVRHIPGQAVQHVPLADNRAHAEVAGEKNTEVRFRFMKICRIEIPLGS
jgi:hypothetical protein